MELFFPFMQYSGKIYKEIVCCEIDFLCNPLSDANGVNGMDRKEETNDDQDGWVVVQRSKRKH